MIRALKLGDAEVVAVGVGVSQWNQKLKMAALDSSTEPFDTILTSLLGPLNYFWRLNTDCCPLSRTEHHENQDEPPSSQFGRIEVRFFTMWCLSLLQGMMMVPFLSSACFDVWSRDLGWECSCRGREWRIVNHGSYIAVLKRTLALFPNSSDGPPYCWISGRLARKPMLVRIFSPGWLLVCIVSVFLEGRHMICTLPFGHFLFVVCEV